MLFVDARHQRSSRRQDLIDEDENRLLRAELDALADNINELTDGEVSGDKILFLVDGCNVGFFHLFADDGDAVGVFLALDRTERSV